MVPVAHSLLRPVIEARTSLLGCLIRDVAVPIHALTIVGVGADFVLFAIFALDVLAMRYGF